MSDEMEIFVMLLRKLYLDGRSCFSLISNENLEAAETPHATTIRVILEGYRLFRTDWNDFTIEIVPQANWLNVCRFGAMGVYKHWSDTVQLREDEFLKVVSVGFHEVAEREFVRGAHQLYPQLLGPEEYRYPGGRLSAGLFQLSHFLAIAAQVLLTENIERCAGLGGRMRAATLAVLKDVDLGGMFFVVDYCESKGTDFDFQVKSYAERWSAYNRRVMVSGGE